MVKSFAMSIWNRRLAKAHLLNFAVEHPLDEGWEYIFGSAMHGRKAKVYIQSELKTVLFGDMVTIRRDEKGIEHYDCLILPDMTPHTLPELTPIQILPLEDSQS